MKKKLVLVLGMITCIFSLTACGSKVEESAAGQQITEAEATAFADQTIESINMISQQGMEDQFASDEVISAAFDSWNAAKEDMGDYQGILDHEVEIGEKNTIINVLVDGSVRDANVELILDKDLALSSITTNIKYSLGELMIKAALNTVIGMGTVFVVLILICIIISAFVYIPKIEAMFVKKEEPKAEEVKKEAVDNTIAQIIESEELADDSELVAVIAAAIAASGGAVSTDGFVVRSIKRANTNKWQRA